jgi:hypothetical protein
VNSARFYSALSSFGEAKKRLMGRPNIAILLSFLAIRPQLFPRKTRKELPSQEMNRATYILLSKDFYPENLRNTLYRVY